MTHIVTTTYRYKPPPPPKRKGRKLAEITGPAVVTAKESSRRPVAHEAAAGGSASPSLGDGADARPVWRARVRPSQARRPSASVIPP